jgi:hypothetical protein
LVLPSTPFEHFEPVRDLIGELAKHYRFVILLDEFERLAVNARLDSNFFANLRSLGDEARYRLGYVTATRRPLETLRREQRIEESYFWYIFGISQVLGLLADDEAQELIRLPVRECLGRELDPAPVLELAGNHPALIQMAMFEGFDALQAGRAPDWPQVRFGLDPYYRSLWQHRTLAERDSTRRLHSRRAEATGVDHPRRCPLLTGFCPLRERAGCPVDPQSAKQEDRHAHQQHQQLYPPLACPAIRHPEGPGRTLCPGGGGDRRGGGHPLPVPG